MQYIEIEEYKNTQWYCAYEECCGVTGEVMKDLLLQSLLDSACAMVDNYIGYSLLKTEEQDIIVGDNSYRKHLKKMNVCEITGFVEICARNNDFYGKLNRYNHNLYLDQQNKEIEVPSGEVYFIDNKTSYIELCRGFKKGNIYRINYVAGLEPEQVPNDIKTAISIIVTQLSQQIDTGNLANPDFNYKMVKSDLTSYHYGSSNYIKNITVKDVNDLNGIPLPAQILLNKYKYSKRLS